MTTDPLSGLPRSGMSRRRLLQGGAAGLASLALPGVGRALAGVTDGIGQPVPSDAIAVARVWPSTRRQALALAAFDDTHAVYADGSLDLLLWPGDRRRLDALGVRYELFEVAQGQPAAGRPSGLLPQPGERDAYRRLPEYIADMQSLATQYPARARMFRLPVPTLEGRLVHGLEIADNVVGAELDGRPTFVVDGAHHAREWPSSELTLMFAYDLLQSYGTDPRVTAILQKARVIVVPVVNPDGFNQSREAPTDRDVADRGAYWRKNKRSFTGLLYTTGNPDAHGTDPNRNYPFNWGGEGGNSNPVDATYAGPQPYAESESRNIAGLLKSMQATAYLTNHTYGRLCMRPWGHTTDPSPDNDFQRELGARMTAYNKYTNQIALQLYPTAGTSRDWAYAALRTIVYTFEHGTAFHPDYKSTVPKQYADNRPAWLLLAEAALDPANHGVVTGRVVNGSGAAQPAAIELRKSFVTKTAGGAEVPEQVGSRSVTRPDGSFEVHANPSTRPTVIQDGGPPETWEVTISTSNGTVKREVFLDRGTRHDLETVVL